MRRKASYTDAEKIDLFDSLYDQCVEDMNESRSDEYDKEYFWEYVMDKVLGLQKSDLDMHNVDIS